jgi:hypothetical protein
LEVLKPPAGFVDEDDDDPVLDEKSVCAAEVEPYEELPPSDTEVL